VLKTKDLLDEVIEADRANPEFPVAVERALLKELAKRRGERGLSQTVVAARMGTSQSALARLEGGESDPRISTVERFALAIGEELSITGGRRRPVARRTAGPVDLGD
jgi:transcriptional regulator with XRE-family HTH domain